MEELRKKCHTDDDSSLNDDGVLDLSFPFSLALWLDQSKTLRQQDIDDQSTVVLRRKFFFSDTNIDQRDPIQLNLLYVQVIERKRKRSSRRFLHSIDRSIVFSVEMELSMEHIP